MHAMVTESSPAVLKRWIGLELRRLRVAAGKGRPEVAQRLRQSRTAVGHLETARSMPSAAVLEILLGFYGVPERLPGFLDLVDAARRGRNWWEHLAGAVPPWFDLFLGLEAGAAQLASFDTYLVPGLLQTPDYARAVMHADPDLAQPQIEQRVTLRLGRQQILDREQDPVELVVVLDESVLYRQRGDRTVMAQQLQHLVAMSQRPGIELQVLRSTAGAHIAQQGSFQLMRFPPEMIGDPGMVYLELLIEGRYYDDADDVAIYERALSRLRAHAATPEDSRTIVEHAATEASAS